MPTKNESLFVHGDVVFLLQLHLDVEYRIVLLYHDRYCSPSQRLDKYLHVERESVMVCVYRGGVDTALNCRYARALTVLISKFESLHALILDEKVTDSRAGTQSRKELHWE